MAACDDDIAIVESAEECMPLMTAPVLARKPVGLEDRNELAGKPQRRVEAAGQLVLCDRGLMTT